MGFCRRCGDIVAGARCKCGGTAVAAGVQWSQSGEQVQDKWQKTYVNKQSARPSSQGPGIASIISHLTGSTNVSSTSSDSPSSLVKRFPKSTLSDTRYSLSATPLTSRVSAHIASTTSSRPPSPLKYSQTGPQPEEGILPVPNSDTLAKVYGSVLQPKESLDSYACAICSTPFSPDATVYPDPNEASGTRFLCRPCFTTNGGSKGNCPTCSRPVLTLKSEGGFVHAAGKYWHKRCFRCEGCLKPMGDNPMVDLLGKPSCVDCFETCLKRDSKPSTPVKKSWDRSEKNSNPGGLSRATNTNISRENSPAIEELEHRLGIKSREGSPALGELTQRLNAVGRSNSDSPSRGSPIPSRHEDGMFESSPVTKSKATGSPFSSRYMASKSLNGQDDGSPSPTRRYERARSTGPESSPTRWAEGENASLHLTGGSVKLHKTGEPVGQHNTGGSVRQHLTGGGIREHRTWDREDRSVENHTTGERDRGRRRQSGERVRSQTTGGSVKRHTTGGSVKQHLTGGSVRHHTTGGSVRAHLTGGSVRTHITGEDAIEEMKRRFLRGCSTSPSRSSTPAVVTPAREIQLADHDTPSKRSTLRTSSSNNSLRSSIARIASNYPSPTPTIPQTLSPPTKTRSPATKIPLPVFGSTRSPTSQPGRESLTGLGININRSVPPTPDFISDFSDTTTQSSGPHSPPRGLESDDVFRPSRTRSSGSLLSKSSFNSPTYASRSSVTRGDFLEGVMEPRLPNSLKKTDSKQSPRSRIPSATRSSTISSGFSAPSNTSCAKCGGALFAISSGGRFVTVPDEETEGVAKTKSYHTECFRCVVCEGVFKESGKGQAVFVKGKGGPCHIECAPPERIRMKPTPGAVPLVASLSSPSSLDSSKPTPLSRTKFTTSSIPTFRSSYTSSTSNYASSSRFDRLPPSTPGTNTSSSFPRFGSSSACPGCFKSVSPMEKGVVPGPHGTRWHAGCLVCGGKKIPQRGIWREERKRDEPGCGKKLDSAAKGDGEGGVWCRECLLLLPTGMRGSPVPSPIRSPVLSQNTGGFPRLTPQLTGGTTMARQFTGLGGDQVLLRQLTGGGLSPTRQLGLNRPGSPSKQTTPGTRPRPKSVIGVRSGGKSMDEGRGMFLVRQLTGGTSGGWD